MDFTAVDKAFADAINQGVFPGADLVVGKGGTIFYQKVYGYRSLTPEKSPLQTNTIFDLASLTKPFATTLAIMVLVREKKLRLEDRVTRIIPTYGVFGKHMTTVRQLLNHTSGLPAWKPYFEEIISSEKVGRINFVASRAAKNWLVEEIHRERPLTLPGSKGRYSDLGFIILGEMVEMLTGQNLDRYCQDKIYKPLGLRETGFVDLTQLRTRRLEIVEDIIAPTEHCPWRQKILCGQVHDDNAYAMGGVAGHAGLFSSARDIQFILSKLGR